MMNSDLQTSTGYVAAVIALFQSGNATDEHWQSMALAVLHASEHDMLEVTAIDRTVLGECPVCKLPMYGGYCDEHLAESGYYSELD